MRKFVSLLLVLVLVLSFTTISAYAEQTAGLKLGLDVTTTIANSNDASDTDGNAQVDTTVVAVLVDAQGKIVDINIDDAQTKMPFTASGKLGSNFPATSQSKLEVGNDYGMKPASPIGKEWFEQIEALRVYVIGKTATEISGIALDSSTHPTDADLTAGCTMAIGNYITGIVAAIEKAVPVDAAATDLVGLGLVTTTSASMDAADGTGGLAQADTTCVAVTVSDAGVVTATLIDSTQGKVAFTNAGKITSDLSVRTATRQELGDAYGMKAISPIGKEWYEQVNAFAAYVTGKTAAQIDGIALDASTRPTDADLTASVTITAGDLKDAVLKSIANIK